MKTKRKSNILFIILLLTNSFFLINSTNLGENVVGKITQEQSIASLASYIEQTPIEITDNAGLLAYSSSGNGLEGSPYLISGYNITTDTGFSIYIHGASVTAYFSIESCYFNSSQYGIHIEGISDNIATVKNNTFVDCNEAAMFIESTNNFAVEGNTFLDSGTAILVEASEEFLIQENTISNCSSGIYANYYEGIFVEMNITATISNNNVSDVAGEAIKINKFSVSFPNIIVDSILITDNIIDNASLGIHVLRSPNAIVENNQLSNIKTYAIELYSYYPQSDSHEYSVKNNIITDVSRGISLEYNINNTIVDSNQITNANMAILANNPSNLTVTNNTIVHGSTQNALDLYQVTDVSIVDNDIFNGTIKIYSSSEVRITNNTIIGASKNIDIFESEGVTIYNNVIGNNDLGTGIDVYAIINLNITWNTLTSLDTGIELYADTARLLQNVSITYNTLETMVYGIYVGSGRIIENCTIQKNTINDISFCGICLHNGGTGLKIIDNFISSDIQAIDVSYNWNDVIISENAMLVYSIGESGRALELRDVDGGEIINNVFFDFTNGPILMAYLVYLSSDVMNMVIYSNEFYSRTALVDNYVNIARDDGVNNIWYNVLTETGNYWSDYNGIGSYSVSGNANSVDLYPITFPDTDLDGLDDMFEIYLGTDLSKTDSDDDGMPDGWEILNELDPLFNDASEDPDSDDLTNLEEYQNNCDPNDSDSDDDYMPDGWEVNYGLNPLVNDASEDADADGIDNFTEYIDGTSPSSTDTDNDGWTDKEEKDAGTNPLDPNSHPEESTTPTDTSYLFIFTIIGLLSMGTFLRKKFSK